VDSYDLYSAALGVGHYQLRSPFGRDNTLGLSADLGLQRRVAEGTAFRLRLGGTQLVQDNPVADAKSGVSGLVGVRHSASLIDGYLSVAPELDVEYRKGPVLHQSLLPAALGDDTTLAVAAGLALSDDKNAVPALGYARIVRGFEGDSEPISLLDVGLGFGTELDFLYWPSNSPNPGGLRIDYRYQHELDGDFRSHELSGGVYYFPKPKWRWGLDLSSSWQDLGADVSARVIETGIRADYYWDANY
jgi:hypothetical protein